MLICCLYAKKSRSESNDEISAFECHCEHRKTCEMPAKRIRSRYGCELSGTSMKCMQKQKRFALLKKRVEIIFIDSNRIKVLGVSNAFSAHYTCFQNVIQTGIFRESIVHSLGVIGKVGNCKNKCPVITILTTFHALFYANNVLRNQPDMCRSYSSQLAINSFDVADEYYSVYFTLETRW